MAAKVYKGKAPLTFVLVGAGDDKRYVQVYKGSPLPAGVTADELDRLESEGFIESGEQTLGLQVQEPSQRKA